MSQPPSRGTISFDAKRGPAPLREYVSKPEPKPHYAKGDNTAALVRLAEIRETERLALRVARELITPLEEQAARYRPRFRAVVDGPLAVPSQPAARTECPTPPAPIAGLVRLPLTAFEALSVSPTILAVLGVRGCRWPLGEPSSNSFRFCNKKRAKGFYCEFHGSMAKK